MSGRLEMRTIPLQPWMLPSTGTRVSATGTCLVHSSAGKVGTSPVKASGNRGQAACVGETGEAEPGWVGRGILWVCSLAYVQPQGHEASKGVRVSAWDSEALLLDLWLLGALPTGISTPRSDTRSEGLSPDPRCDTSPLGTAASQRQPAVLAKGLCSRTPLCFQLSPAVCIQFLLPAVHPTKLLDLQLIPADSLLTGCRSTNTLRAGGTVLVALCWLGGWVATEGLNQQSCS